MDGLIDWEETKRFLRRSGEKRRLGAVIRSFRELPSTQAPAKEAARGGAPHGTVFVADFQSAGRGRRDRLWSSSPGVDLTFSAILRPNVETRHSSLLNLAAALAARCAIEGFFPPGCGNIEIKWPNDILANGKKICGIICEAAGDAKRLGYAVLGIGINANGRAEDMQALGPPGKMKATSLMAELGHAVSLPELLAGVLNGLEEFSGMVEAEGDRARLIEIYRSRCSTVGRSVKIQSDEGEFTGTAIGVAEDGALVLKAESGEETAFRAADVIHATME